MLCSRSRFLCQSLCLYLFIQSTLGFVPSNISTGQLPAGKQHEICNSDPVGYLNYLCFYFCQMENEKVTAFLLLSLWLSLLFSTIGIAASEFFCPNLEHISHSLGISENIAGVTFLAFGNGAPDVFSTFAAMKADKGSLAIGELLGAALFIIAVVLGSMAIVQPFRVIQRPFYRDVAAFIVAVLLTMIMVADGILHLWECFALVGLYAVYVISIISDSWYSTTIKANRIAEIISRNRFAVPGIEYGAGQVDEQTRLLTPEIGELENQDNDDISEEYSNLSHRMTEIQRPDSSACCSPLVPIRPSLLGALEFRSVVARLSQESSDALRLQKASSYDCSSTDNYSVKFGRPPIGLGLQIVNESPVDVQSRRRSLSTSDLQKPVKPVHGVPDIALHQTGNLEFRNSDDNRPSLQNDFLQKLHGESPRNNMAIDGSSIPKVTISPAPPEISTPPHTRESLQSFTLKEHFSSPSGVVYTLFPTLESLGAKSPFQKILSLVAVPAVLLLKITVPVVHSHRDHAVISDFPAASPSANDTEGMYSFSGLPENETTWKRWLVFLQSMAIPVLLALLFFPGRFLPFLWALLSGSICWVLLAIFTTWKTQPKWYGLLSYVGFFVGVVWISSIANEVVGVLQALGIILNISDAILGLTVFAMGNSLGDLVANVTIAKMGFPLMAMSACFGGPMLNILLGIGISGLYMNIQHPGNPSAYCLHISPHLIVSGSSLLALLMMLLILVPRYGMSRKVGLGLVSVYLASLVVNLALEFNIPMNELNIDSNSY